MLKRLWLPLFLVLFVLGAVFFYLNFGFHELTGIVRDVATRAPVAGAQVNAGIYHATTDGTGRYTINLPRGKYVLSAQHDGYNVVQTELNVDDWLASTIVVDFLLPQNQLTVVVRDAETNLALSNVQVMVGDKPAITNAQGILQTQGVKSGTPIAVHFPGYQPIAVAYDGQGDFDLPLVPNTVKVSVIDKYSQQPVASAKIQFDHQAVDVDAQGNAVLRRIKPGTTFAASAPGFENASAQFAGGDVQITLRPNTLDGVVTDATTNQPISGTLIYFGNRIVSTNSKGEYHLDDVPAQATLFLKAPGYAKTQVEVSGTARRDIKLNPFLVKGIHLPFGLSEERWNEVVDLVAKTELNAVILDVKAERGRLMWNSQVPLAKEINAPLLIGVDLTRVVADCKAKKIYCIARIPAFQDNLLASARPAQAARLANGTVFTESGGQQWLNPFLPENRNYVIALAKEITALGFDEVQFDYVRFPGLTNTIAWGTEYTESTRIAAIAEFLAQAQKELRPTGVFVSADVFGLTTATDDDQHTGQRLRDLGPYLDYVSPMVYPDTWVEASDLLTRGLKISNCTEANRCPYDVIYNSYKRAVEKTSTKVRLWLQAYAGRGNFGVEQYRLQKKAAVDAGSYGWMFWNALGVYDPKMFDGK
jgi:hypothetical protein